MTEKPPVKPYEGYYAIAALVALLLTLIGHYFLLARVGLHPTLHAAIALVVFIVVSSVVSIVFEKLG